MAEFAAKERGPKSDLAGVGLGAPPHARGYLYFSLDLPGSPGTEGAFLPLVIAIDRPLFHSNVELYGEPTRVQTKR